jgi:hypothetical protein
MNGTENPNEILSREAGMAIEANRFLVEIPGDLVEYATAAGAAHGVSRYAAEPGEAASYQATGDLLVEAGEAIPDGSDVEVGADGVAMVAAAGTVVGRCNHGSSAGAAGQLITIRFHPVGQ